MLIELATFRLTANQNNNATFLLSSPVGVSSRTDSSLTAGKEHQTAGWQTTVTDVRAHLNPSGGQLYGDRSTGALDLHQQVGASDNEHLLKSNNPAGEGPVELIEKRTLHNELQGPVYNELQAIRQINVDDFIFIATVLTLARGPFEQSKPTRTTVRTRLSPTSTKNAFGLTDLTEASIDGKIQNPEDNFSNKKEEDFIDNSVNSSFHTLTGFTPSDQMYIDTYDDIYENRKEILRKGYHPTLAQNESYENVFSGEHRRRIKNFIAKKPLKITAVRPPPKKQPLLIENVPWISGQIPWYDFCAGTVTVWSPITDLFCISHCLMKILGTQRVAPYNSLRAASLDYIELQFYEYHTDNTFDDAVKMLLETWDIKGTTIVGVAASDVHHAIVIRDPSGSDYVRQLISDTLYHGYEFYEHTPRELKMRAKSMVGVPPHRLSTDFIRTVVEKIVEGMGDICTYGCGELLVYFETSGYMLIRLVLTAVAIINGTNRPNSYVLEDLSSLDDLVTIAEIDSSSSSYNKQIRSIYKSIAIGNVKINSPLMLFFIRHDRGITPWLFYTPYSLLTPHHNPRLGYWEDYRMSSSHYPQIDRADRYQFLPNLLYEQVSMRIRRYQPLRDQIALLQQYVLMNRHKVRVIYHQKTLYINPIVPGECRNVVCDILSWLYEDVLPYNFFEVDGFMKMILREQVSSQKPFYFSVKRIPLRDYPPRLPFVFEQLVIDSILDYPVELPYFDNRLHGQVLILHGKAGVHAALAFSTDLKENADFDENHADPLGMVDLWRQARGPNLIPYFLRDFAGLDLFSLLNTLVLRDYTHPQSSSTQLAVFRRAISFTLYIKAARLTVSMCQSFLRTLLTTFMFLRAFYYRSQLAIDYCKDLVPQYTRTSLRIMLKLITTPTFSRSNKAIERRRILCPIPNASGHLYFSSLLRRATAHLAAAKPKFPRYMQRKVTGLLSRKAKFTHPVRAVARTFLKAKTPIRHVFLAYGSKNGSNPGTPRGGKQRFKKIYVPIDPKSKDEKSDRRKEKPVSTKPKSKGQKKQQPGHFKAEKNYQPGDYLGFNTSFNQPARKENFNAPKTNPAIFKPRLPLSQAVPRIAPYVPGGKPIDMIRCANFLTPEFLQAPYATPKYRNGLMGKIHEVKENVFWKFRWGLKDTGKSGFGVMASTSIDKPYCLEFVLMMLYPLFVGKPDLYLARWMSIVGSGATHKEIYDSSFLTLDRLVADNKADIDAMIQILGAKDIEDIRSITDLFPLLQERYVDCRLLFTDIKANVDTPPVPFIENPIARVFAYIEDKPKQIIKAETVSYACHLLIEFPRAIEDHISLLSADCVGSYTIPKCLKDLNEEEMLAIAPQLIAYSKFNELASDGDGYTADALNYAISMSMKPIACYDLTNNVLLNLVSSPNTVLLWRPKPNSRSYAYIGITHSGVGLPAELGPCLNDEFPHPQVIHPCIFLPVVKTPPKPWYKDYIIEPGYKWYTQNYKKFMNKRLSDLDLEDFLDSAPPQMLLFTQPKMLPNTVRIYQITPTLYTCAKDRAIMDLVYSNLDPHHPTFRPKIHYDPKGAETSTALSKIILAAELKPSTHKAPGTMLRPNATSSVVVNVNAPPPPNIPGIAPRDLPVHHRLNTVDIQDNAAKVLATITDNIADIKSAFKVADVAKFKKPVSTKTKLLIELDNDEEDKAASDHSSPVHTPRRLRKFGAADTKNRPDRGESYTPDKEESPLTQPRLSNSSVMADLKSKANKPNLVYNDEEFEPIDTIGSRLYQPAQEVDPGEHIPTPKRRYVPFHVNPVTLYMKTRELWDIEIPALGFTDTDTGAVKTLQMPTVYYPVKTAKGYNEEPLVSHSHIISRALCPPVLHQKTRCGSVPPRATRIGKFRRFTLDEEWNLMDPDLVKNCIDKILEIRTRGDLPARPIKTYCLSKQAPIPSQKEIFTPTFRAKLDAALDDSRLYNPELMITQPQPPKKILTGDPIVDKICKGILKNPKSHQLVLAKHPLGDPIEITQLEQFKVVKFNSWMTDWLAYLGLASCYRSQLGKEIAILCGIHLQNSFLTKKMTIAKRKEPAPTHIPTVYPSDYIRGGADKLGTLYTPNQRVLKFDTREDEEEFRDDTKWKWSTNPIEPPKNEVVDHTTRSLVRVLFGREIADNKGASCMPTNWFRRILSLGVDYLQTRGYGPINTNLPYVPWSPAIPEVFGPNPYMIILGFHPPGVGDKAHFTDTVMFSNDRIIYYNGQLNNPWHLPAVDALFIHPSYCLMSIPISAHVDLVFLSLEPAPDLQITTQGVVEDMFSHFMATESSNIANPNTNHTVVKNRFAIYFCWKAYQGNVQSTGLYTTLDRMQKSRITLDRDITNSISGYQQYGVKNIHVVIVRRLMRKWAHPAFLDVECILDGITRYGKSQKAWYEKFIPCGIWSDEARINNAVQTWCDRFTTYRRLERNIPNLTSHVFDAMSREELMGKCKPWWVWFVTISNETIQMMRANPHDGAMTPVLLSHFLLNTVDLAIEAEPFLMRWADPLSRDTRFICHIIVYPHQNPIVRENNKRLAPRGIPAYLAYGTPPHDPYDPLNRNVRVEDVDPPIGLRQGEPIVNDVEASRDFFDHMPLHNRVLENLEYFTKEGIPIPNQHDFITYLLNSDLEHMRKPAVKYVTGVIGTARGRVAKPVVAKTSSLNLARTILNRHAGSRAVENPVFRAYASRLFRREARKLARKMLAALDDLHEDLSFDAYLQNVEPCNRFSYTKGYEKFKKDAQIPLLLQCMMKTNESSYPDVTLTPDQVADQVRPRAIFNPSEQNKAVIGWINWVLIKLIKKVLPSFVHGLDIEKLEILIEERLRALGVGTLILSGDGKGHDSLQHAWWIDCVDNTVTRILMPALAARLGLSKLEHDSILRSLTSLLIPFVAYYPGTKRIMMRGHLWGTVFSGHPTRTTFGNTLRMYILYKVIMKLAHIPKSAYSLLMSGDDTLNFLKPQYEQAFLVVLWQFVSRDLEVHGIGYQLKRMFVSTTVIDFLSKTGRVLDQGCVTLSRIPQRIVLGGNLQDIVRRDFKVPHHAFAVTQGFYAYEGTHVLLPSYIDYRRKNLKLLAPSEKVLANYLRHEQLYKAALFRHQHPRSHYVTDAGSLLSATTPYGIFQGFQPTPLFYELAHTFGYDAIDQRLAVG
jgi:hypothetical protein